MVTVGVSLWVRLVGLRAVGASSVDTLPVGATKAVPVVLPRGKLVVERRPS